MDKVQTMVEPLLDRSVDGDSAVEMTEMVDTVNTTDAAKTTPHPEAQMPDDAVDEPLAEPLVEQPTLSPTTTTEVSGEEDIKGFDLTNEDDPVPARLLSDAMQSAIRQSVERAVGTAVDTAVSMAVAQAVSAAMASAVADLTEDLGAQISARAEQNLMEHIRSVGQRPTENGVRDTVGVRMHPAVDHLTRKDRAALAARAARGETVRL